MQHPPLSVRVRAFPPELSVTNGQSGKLGRGCQRGSMEMQRQ